jgi:hypothetical protein
MIPTPTIDFLRNKKELAGRATGFEIAMGSGSVGQRVGMFETKLQGAVGNGIEDSGSSKLEVFARGDIIPERRSCDVERAEKGESDEIEGGHSSAGASEEDKRSARTEHFQRLVEGRLPDRVIDGVKPLGGLLLDLCGKVFQGVENDFIGSGGAGKSRLLLAGDRGKDAGSQGLCHLREKEADATGSSMDEDLVTGANGVSGVSKVMGGHALKHGSGSLLKGNSVRNMDKAVSRGNGQLGVGSGNTAPGHPIADFYGGNAVAKSDHRSGGLLPGSVRERSRITTLTKIDVNKVDAGGFEANERFSGTGSGSRQIAEGEDFRASGSENLNGLHSALDASGRRSDYL